MHADEYDCAVGPRPAQGVLQGGGDADHVENEVEAAHEHAVAEAALVHPPAGQGRGLGEAVIADQKGVISPELPGQLGLPLELGQGGEGAVRLDEAQGLDQQETDGAAAEHEHLIAGTGQAAPGGVDGHGDRLGEDGLLVGHGRGHGHERAGRADEAVAEAAADRLLRPRLGGDFT